MIDDPDMRDCGSPPGQNGASSQEFEHAVTATIEAMRAYAAPFTTPITTHDFKNLEPMMWGSGSYYGSGSRQFLITNDHVAIERPKRDLAFLLKSGSEYVRMVRKFYRSGRPQDVAVTEVTDEWNATPNDRNLIDLNQFDQRHDPVPGEILFVAGYTHERSRLSGLAGGLLTLGTAYGTQACSPAAHEDFDPKYHFAIHYSSEYVKLSTTLAGSKLPDPHGMSGSLIWNTKRVECMSRDAAWSPDHARVTGIAWGWPSNSVCLFATRVEHFREFAEFVMSKPSQFDDI